MATQERAPAPATVVRGEIEGMAAQFKAALPPQIPVERFVRVVMTAINGEPDLLNADRRSLYEAAMKAAQDGLLPDKREAAFVVYNTKTAQGYIKKVQYMPMVWGIVKKVRNSGELSTITAHVVHENDQFAYALGDDEMIRHQPLLKGDRGAAILAYAIAKTKDGAIYREVMTADEIKDVMNISKAKESGPWAGPFVLEMWRKTVIRRLAKRLPMSTDLEKMMDREDENFDFSAARVVSEPIKAPKAKEETNASDHPKPATVQDGGLSAEKSSGPHVEPGQPNAGENAPRQDARKEAPQDGAREPAPQQEELTAFDRIKLWLDSCEGNPEMDSQVLSIQNTFTMQFTKATNKKKPDLTMKQQLELTKLYAARQKEARERKAQ